MKDFASKINLKSYIKVCDFETFIFYIEIHMTILSEDSNFFKES